MCRDRTGHGDGQRLQFRRQTVAGRGDGPAQYVGGDRFRGEERADPHQRERVRVDLSEALGGHPDGRGQRVALTGGIPHEPGKG